MRLKDKVTIITGAGHGIGRAYAKRFAEEGANVVIAEIDAKAGERVAAEIQELGRSAWARATDVVTFEDVKGLMNETVQRFGRCRRAVEQRGNLRDSAGHKMQS